MINLSLKDYEVVSQIYRGKKSIIYKAERIADNQPVILKLKNEEYPTNEDSKCLQHEFLLGNSINSNAVIKYLEIIKYDNKVVIIEEYFKGEPLAKLIEACLFSVEEFLAAAISICDGLEKIHAGNIIHKDINPSNILFSKSDNQVKIIDFGSAENSSFKRSVQNISEDSYYYISPEQTGRINRTVDYRSDLYSLGIVYYLMLTGHLPFESKDLSELVYCHIAKHPKPVNEINPTIPKIISDVIMKLIEKNPEKRYQSAVDLKIDLKRCLKNIRNIFNFNFKPGEFSSQLSISTKLYGREDQIKILLKSFERVSVGGSELLVVAGSPGIGKSALIKEFYKTVIQKQGHFILGKFEQLESNTPYSAIIKALENFIKILLMDSSARLKVWRQRIVAAVGNNGQVIVDVLPSLELIIGEQASVPELGATETQNRFNLVFENFMQTIANREHPLVMFIDDWQWADSASLNFIKMLMINKSNKYLLVIGAYRDYKDELFQLTVIDELVKNNTTLTKIKLNELHVKDIQAMLEDTLISFQNDIQELAGFIHDKTQGNPFFVKQFLKSLYDKGYIWFDYDYLYWCWDIEKIKKLNITENVVDLLISKIGKIDSKIIQILKYGACIGNQFDLHSIALIDGESFESIQAKLQVAVNEGLVVVDQNEDIHVDQANSKFKFVHDRVQQVVYSMLADKNKFSIHLQLGRSFLENYSDTIKAEQLFEMIWQLNTGRTMIIDKAEKIKLAEMNLKAGSMAKSSAAYNSAFIYFEVGIELLDKNAWQEHYELSLQLYSQITETAYLISEFTKMNKFAEIVLQNAKTLIDKIIVYKIIIEALQAQLNLKEALNTCISVLNLLGIEIPVEPTRLEVEEIFESAWKSIAEIKVENLAKLPPMKDPEKLGAMQILLNSVSVTYKAAPILMPIITCKMVELSIKFGNASFSPAVYSLYGLTLCSLITNIELGEKLEKYIECAHKIAKINAELIKKQNMKLCKATVLDVDHCCVIPWKEHLKKTFKPLMEGYWVGVENGSFEYGGYCLMNYTKHSLYAGQPLEEMEKEIETNIKRLQRIKQGFSLNWEYIFGQFVHNMQGKTKDPLKLIGDLCDEDKMISTMQNVGDLLGMVFLFLSKMILNYHFRNYSAAFRFGEKVKENLAGASATIDIAIYYFYDSLTRLAVYSIRSDDEKKEILEKVNKNQKMMSIWSEFSPFNFLHKFYLVEAEICRVTGKFPEARKHYDKAIGLAKENEYLNEEALAYELAGNFYLSDGRKNSAKAYFREARYRYQLWGAKAKVNDLEDKYPKIFMKSRNLQDISKNIDLLTIIKASQAISSEINLETLLNRLMTVMLENMGAQRGFLILKQEDELLIEAYVDKECGKEKLLISMPLDKYESIPKTVIRFTARTGENVAFPGKLHKLSIDKDPYIVANKPKSFFSTAIILKNEVKGVLYLSLF